MPRINLLVLALILVPFAAARGETPQPADMSPPASQAQASARQPDLISFSANYVDFDKDEPRTQGADFNLEYRWGDVLPLTAQTDWLDFGIDPLVGGMVSTRSQLYGFGGFAFDFLFWKHFVFTESEAVGLFDSGNAKPLGSFIEFRSQAELGWRFDNNIRLTADVGHISNAGLTRHNPGEEYLGGYVHIPVCALFGH